MPRPVIAAEAFPASGRLTDLLSVIKHHRPPPHGEKHRTHGLADFHAEATPFLRAGDADLVVIFRVAQGLMEAAAGERELVQVVCPFSGIVNALQRIVGRIIVNSVEARIQQLVEHVSLQLVGMADRH
mgnify:CR=1 FL=1